MKYFLLAVGWISLVLGVLGIFLPVLPTTPFLLLTAACFSKGSPTAHRWLINHPWFGKTIQHYQSGLGIPLRIKIKAIITMWLTISLSAYFFIPIVAVKILLLVIASCVTGYILWLPTLDDSSLED
ncbi:Inner membrane protein YbaN [Sinobacterium norvegicum]|uniref:Inner membrane protein n=1 Tax=Sinobacterium norvegicum TaxID=1641715 RepID=A0ABM9ADE3_9GAMM|nr:YbaN family protein [Sinobacterium norvegicum]CAH0990965.1 Inner membrane protein YbaN [Sinobacterium norvegicum]